MMRYARARAESWGKKIHFSQQNAVETNFADGSFDIITHCLLTHEMPVKEIRRLFKEAFRLLATGGIMVIDGISCAFFGQVNPIPGTAANMRPSTGSSG